MPPAPATDNAVRVPYAILGAVLALLVALATGWGATSEQRGQAAARLEALETYKADHARENATRLAELQAIDAAHEKRMNEHFVNQTAQNAELQKTLTELRILVARQRP